MAARPYDEQRVIIYKILQAVVAVNTSLGLDVSAYTPKPYDEQRVLLYKLDLGVEALIAGGIGSGATRVAQTDPVGLPTTVNAVWYNYLTGGEWLAKPDLSGWTVFIEGA